MSIKTYLTSNEIRKMIDGAYYIRDKTILSFLADTGARVSELINLKVGDLDLDNQVAHILHLKRGIKKKCPCGKFAGRNTLYCSKCGQDLSHVVPEGIEVRKRLISIGPETVELLRGYTEGMESSARIIDLTRQQVYNIVREVGKVAGLKGKVILNPETEKKHYVHPHTFRDSLAVSWLSYAGNDVGKQKALQEHLGHRNFETTMRYFKLQPARVKQVSDEVRQMRFSKAEGREKEEEV